MKKMKKISKIFLVLTMIFSQLSSVVTVLADEIMTKDLNLNLNYEKGSCSLFIASWLC